MDQAAQGSGDPYWGKAVLVEAPVGSLRMPAGSADRSTSNGTGAILAAPIGTKHSISIENVAAKAEVDIDGASIDSDTGRADLRFRAGHPRSRDLDDDRQLGRPIPIEAPLDLVLTTPGRAAEFADDEVARRLASCFGALRIGGMNHQPLDVLLRTARTRTGRSSTVISFDLSVAASAVSETIWIDVGGGDSGWPRFAVTVPSDIEPVPVRLQLVLVKAAPDDAAIPAAFSARIGPSLPSHAARRAVTWAAVRKAQEAGFAEQSTLLPSNVGGAILEGSLSPLAAVIAGFVLLQTGELDLSQDWPRRLASRFDFVDAAVLWVEVLARRAEAAEGTIPRDATFDTLCGGLQAIAHLGAAQIGAALKAALERVEKLRAAYPNRAVLRLAKVADRLGSVGPYARSGGTFAALGPLPDCFDPRQAFAH